MKTKKALLLIDLQNDYFEGGLNSLVGSLDAVLKAQKLIQYFRLNSLPIIHIRKRSGNSVLLEITKSWDVIVLSPGFQ